MEATKIKRKWIGLKAIFAIHFNQLQTIVNMVCKTIILHNSYLIQVYFAPIVLAKYIVFFQIWMDNWWLVLANMKQVACEK